MGRRHDRANAGGRGPTAARSLELVTGLAIAACQIPATAHAQEQSDVQIAVVGGLEEILVTARKREENLQTTPLSVTAFTGEALAQQGIETLVDLAYKNAKNTFTLPGLGKLVLVNRKARIGRNPATGESIQIPAKRVVKFRVAKAAKDAILGAK